MDRDEEMQKFRNEVRRRHGRIGNENEWLTGWGKEGIIWLGMMEG